MLKGAGLNCMVVGRENLIITCYADCEAQDILDLVNANFSFHPTNLRLQKLDAIPLNSNGKPDYASIGDQFL
jgi:hypothetical protein